jgi:hypothetical protein
LRVPKGGDCSVCLLEPSVLERLLAKWREGLGPVRLHRWLEAEGVHVTAGAISSCLSRSRHHGDPTDPTTARDLKADRLGKVADLLERSDIDPTDIGKIQSIRISEWQGLTKNEEGEAELHDLRGASIVLSPEWAEGPSWPVVQPVAPVTIKPGPRPRKTPTRASGEGWKRAVILPDTQIGYRRDLQTLQLDPFHDEKALDLAMQLVRAAEPDLVIWLGDFLDLAAFGRFVQEASFAHTMQQTIDFGHLTLARAVANAPTDCRHLLLEGNHDARLQKYTLANALAAFGLRRADAPAGWPVLSVPNLLAMDTLGVEYLSGYPANEFWLNDNLRVIHGIKVRSAGSTAQAVVDDERVSSIFGHVHRIELVHRTAHLRHGPATRLAVTPGCLCRTDGAVPSTKSGQDLMGRPLTQAENWQQGMAIVDFEDGDGRFDVELVEIHPQDGGGRWARWRGLEFAAT